MPFRFWRRFKIIPGVKINAHKSGLSVSLGPQGGQLTIGGDGVRVTGGLQGTGLFMTKKIVRKISKSSSNSKQIVCQNKKEYKMFESFLNAIDHIESDYLDDAIQILQDKQFDGIADVQNLLGWMYIQTDDYDLAVNAFVAALKLSENIGELFNHLKIKITFGIPLRIGSEIHVDLENECDIEQIFISMMYAFHADYLTKENPTDKDMTEIQVRQKLYEFYEDHGGLKSFIYALDIAIAIDDHKDIRKSQELLNVMAGIEGDFFIMLFRSIVAIELNKKQAAIDFLSELIKKRSAPLELRLKARGLRADIYTDWDMEHLANKDREWVETMGGKVSDE